MKKERRNSNDEKLPASHTSAAGLLPAAQFHCHNCFAIITKPLRCGTCKKVEYCSAACQKDDWRFHKRVCSKPEAPNGDISHVQAGFKPIKNVNLMHDSPAGDSKQICAT